MPAQEPFGGVTMIHRLVLGVTAIPPSGGGVIECRLFSLDAVFDKIVPFTV
jgi:hypothetical protein